MEKTRKRIFFNILALAGVVIMQGLQLAEEAQINCGDAASLTGSGGGAMAAGANLGEERRTLAGAQARSA